jgi:hypothetical protein
MQDPIPSLFVKPTVSDNDKTNMYLNTFIIYGYTTKYILTPKVILRVKEPLIHILKEICYN